MIHHKVRKIVHRLRARPEEERRHILTLSMIAVCGVMLVLWIWSLGADLSSEETKSKLQNDLKPFSVLKTNLIDGWDSANSNTSSEVPVENSYEVTPQ